MVLDNASFANYKVTIQVPLAIGLIFSLQKNCLFYWTPISDWKILSWMRKLYRYLSCNSHYKARLIDPIQAEGAEDWAETASNKSRAYASSINRENHNALYCSIESNWSWSEVYLWSSSRRWLYPLDASFPHNYSCLVDIVLSSSHHSIPERSPSLFELTNIYLSGLGHVSVGNKVLRDITDLLRNNWAEVFCNFCADIGL